MLIKKLYLDQKTKANSLTIEFLSSSSKKTTDDENNHLNIDLIQDFINNHQKLHNYYDHTH